jgi:hypothetical protein
MGRLTMPSLEVRDAIDYLHAAHSSCQFWRHVAQDAVGDSAPIARCVSL